MSTTPSPNQISCKHGTERTECLLCREQIYKRIMEESEGDTYTYNYEDFVAYDAINRNYQTTRSIAPLSLEAYEEAIQKYRANHRPPVYIKKTYNNKR